MFRNIITKAVIGRQKNQNNVWKSARDPKTGRTYYYHVTTRETTWQKPLELYSTEEREKDRQQREFFAAMEANIRRNIQMGVMPENPASSGSDKEKEDAGPHRVSIFGDRKVSPTSVLDQRDNENMKRLEKELSGIEFEGLPKPDLAKKKTCETTYLGSTMSTPDKDKTILMVCSVFRSYMLETSDLSSESSRKYAIFNDAKPSLTIPSLDEIVSFYRTTFFKSQMEADCIIMSLIYVEHLMQSTNHQLRPCPCNWKSIFFSSMILSSKVWADLSTKNSVFSQCGGFSLKRINQLEVALLNCLRYNVKVTSSEYAKYYFELREMCSEEWNILLNMESAKFLEGCISNFQRKGSPIRRRVKVEDKRKMLALRQLGLLWSNLFRCKNCM